VIAGRGGEGTRPQASTVPGVVRWKRIKNVGLEGGVGSAVVASHEASGSWARDRTKTDRSNQQSTPAP
jgi:hypothetical protein